MISFPSRQVLTQSRQNISKRRPWHCSVFCCSSVVLTRNILGTVLMNLPLETIQFSYSWPEDIGSHLVTVVRTSTFIFSVFSFVKKVFCFPLMLSQLPFKPLCDGLRDLVPFVYFQKRELCPNIFTSFSGWGFIVAVFVQRLCGFINWEALINGI